MSGDRIGVGIIGVSAERGWAARAHLPALRALPDYEVRALSTTRQESADAAAAAFGVPFAFDNPVDLTTHPDVDLVVVTVKVPHHFELVSAALDAGKSVYCEWPLGRDLAEATELATRARRLGVHTAVGLQTRGAPVINRVRDLVADGYVGEVLSTTLVADAMDGNATDRFGTYLLDRANGANLLTIPVGHAADALAFTLGEWREFSSVLANRRPEVTVRETGERVQKTSPDQVAVVGELVGGATAVVHFRGGLARGTGIRWDINGTDGDLRITAAGGVAGISPLTLYGARPGEPDLAELAMPAGYTMVPGELAGTPAFNVAQTYAALALDLRAGTTTAPTFDDAVVRHRMIAALESSAATGSRGSYDPNPPASG